MGMFRSDRNFGFGKQLSYAGFNALRDTYGKKHATVEAHRARWRVFADYCKKIGINDARCITIDILSAFGVHLREEIDEDKMEVAYAQNLLSSANVVLECLRKDRKVSVKPAGFVGKRRIVRTVMPKGDREVLTRAVAVLNERGHFAAAFAVQFSREIGLRLREACLLGLETALGQALATGKIDVREGTKGGRGRNVERLVPATERMVDLLRMAQGLGTRNLIPAGSSLKQFMKHVESVWAAARGAELGRIHDLRAAWAVERYEALTGGCQAPCVAGCRVAPKDIDREARRILSLELGHFRLDVVSAYVGGTR